MHLSWGLKLVHDPLLQQGLLGKTHSKEVSLYGIRCYPLRDHACFFPKG